MIRFVAVSRLSDKQVLYTHTSMKHSYQVQVSTSIRCDSASTGARSKKSSEHSTSSIMGSRMSQRWSMATGTLKSVRPSFASRVSAFHS